MSWPEMSSGDSFWYSSMKIDIPSYSSPWLPPTSRARGPSPLRIDMIGTGSQPYADRWLDQGMRT